MTTTEATDATQEKAGGSGLLGSLLEALRKSPATDRLKGQASHYAQAQVRSVGARLTSRVTGVTKGLGKAPGSLRTVGEVAKGVAGGKSPTRAAIGVAGKGLLGKAKGVLGKVKERFKKLFSRGKAGPKMTNIIEDIRIGVPLRVVYDQWSVYEEFPSFMKAVESVSKTDDVHSVWRVKIWWFRRSWTATVMEQVPDRYIAWTSDGAKGTTEGKVTFHPLADDLTQVLLTMEYYPKGFIERVGNIWRTAGRRTRLELKHFRRFITKRGEATGSWRGEIHDGEVTRYPEGEEPPEEGAGAEEREESAEERAQREEQEARQGEAGEERAGEEQPAEARSEEPAQEQQGEEAPQEEEQPQPTGG